MGLAYILWALVLEAVGGGVKLKYCRTVLERTVFEKFEDF